MNETRMVFDDVLVNPFSVDITPEAIRISATP